MSFVISVEQVAVEEVSAALSEALTETVFAVESDYKAAKLGVKQALAILASESIDRPVVTVHVSGHTGAGDKELSIIVQERSPAPTE